MPARGASAARRAAFGSESRISVNSVPLTSTPQVLMLPLASASAASASTAEKSSMFKNSMPRRPAPLAGLHSASAVMPPLRCG